MPIFTLNDKYITKSSKNRLYSLDKPIIGLTGGIATGKSAASKILTELGQTVIDADLLVKAIYNSKEALKFISSVSPETIFDGKIDFKSLRELFFSEEVIKEQIESFIYPRLKEHFLRLVPKDKEGFIFYDAPILFERELDKKVDQTLLIYAPKEIQVERLIKRDGISKELALKILSHQMDIELKKQKSNFVIENTDSLDRLRLELKTFLDSIKSKNN